MNELGFDERRLLDFIRRNPTSAVRKLTEKLEVKAEQARLQRGVTPRERIDFPGKETGPRGGARSPTMGDYGVERSIEAAAARGDTALVTEMWIRVTTPSGELVDVRVDLVTRTGVGPIEFVDAKFGPGSGLTPNQAIAYPIIRARGGVPFGPNAERAFAGTGWRSGDPIGATVVRVEWWPSPW
jgi:hypothetical protein